MENQEKLNEMCVMIGNKNQFKTTILFHYAYNLSKKFNN